MSKLSTMFNQIINKSRRVVAFTLAEVLIVLGIVGIIAELTIPNLIQNANDQSTIAMLKEDMSILQQAIKAAEPNDGRICDWWPGGASWDTDTINNNASNIFSKYLKVIKNCGTGTGCFSPNGYKPLSSSVAALPSGYSAIDTQTTFLKMILANGSSVAFIPAQSFDGTIYQLNGFTIYIDINGLKGPNRWGYDMFRLYVFSYFNDINQSQIVRASGVLTDNKVNSPGGCYSTSSGLGGYGIGCAVWPVYSNTVKYKNGESLP